MSRVAIIDYGLGNLQAVEKALVKAGGGATVFRCYERDALRRADCVVLPGGGPLRACVDELKRIHLDELLRDALASKPLLAINIGMQALGREGLDLIPVDVVAMNADGVHDIRLPHIGWDRVHRTHGHALWTGIAQDSHFYFAHRSRVVANEQLVAATSEYGERFPSVLLRENFAGVQFQPEVSHVNGMRFLANFINWDGREGPGAD